jgi:hypothetical protein
MSKEKKEGLKEGYVPQGPPKKPLPDDKKGYVPPSPPKKPSEKPTGGKK